MIVRYGFWIGGHSVQAGYSVQTLDNLLMLLMQMQVPGVFLRAESNSSTPDTWHTVCSHYIHYTHPSQQQTRPGLT